MPRLGVRRNKKWTDTTHDGTESLTGGPAPSLDGQSLQLPDEDDISSLNTDLYAPSPAKPRPSARLMYESDQRAEYVNGDGQYPVVGGADNPEATPKEDDSDTQKKGGIIPSWLSESPPLLKAVIILSAVVLLASIVLIGIAFGMQDKGSNIIEQTSGAGVAIITNFPTIAPGVPLAPTTQPMEATPISTPVPTQKPTSMPTPEAPFTWPPTHPPTFSPTSGPPTLAPTDVPTSPPSLAPTPSPTTQSPTTNSPTPVPTTNSPTTIRATQTTTFYMIGGVYEGAGLAELPANLKSLPKTNNNNFLVHLGDWNDVTEGCSEERFVEFDKVFSNTRFPVYVLLGGNEYNNCVTPSDALTLWDKYCSNYWTEHWNPPSYEVTPTIDKNFAFTMDEVLFIGIQLFSGRVLDTDAWLERNDAILDFIDQQVAEYETTTRFTVIFANAGPDENGLVETFYSSLNQRTADTYLRTTVIVHKNFDGDGWTVDQNYLGNEFLVKVALDGGVWPPMKVEVQVDSQTISFNQGNWDTVAT